MYWSLPCSKFHMEMDKIFYREVYMGHGSFTLTWQFSSSFFHQNNIQTATSMIACVLRCSTHHNNKNSLPYQCLRSQLQQNDSLEFYEWFEGKKAFVKSPLSNIFSLFSTKRFWFFWLVQGTIFHRTTFNQQFSLVRGRTAFGRVNRLGLNSNRFFVFCDYYILCTERDNESNIKLLKYYPNVDEFECFQNSVD